MRIVNSSQGRIALLNFDDFLEKKETKRRHSTLLPDTIRCIICGPSNCGKTNVIFNLLFDPLGLKFANVYIFSKSLNQRKYQFLGQVLTGTDIGYFPFTENDDVIVPEEAKPDSIMIFDDIACERHNNIRSYFTRGRHNDVDSFYLGQTYSKIPKQLIRDNANLIVLFKQDERNLKHIYDDQVTTDVPFSVFKNICSLAWKDKHGFLVINKDCEIEEGRYRIGFDRFVKGLQDDKK